jgi:hypothetical protein
MAATAHPLFIQPADPSTKIWRYMSLTKFIWILQKKVLYFSRSDCLGDPFEGHYSRITAASEEEFVSRQLTDEAFAKRPGAEKMLRDQFKNTILNISEIKKFVFVNCWHINKNESPAMWKLYAWHQESVCIQSTYRALAHLLPDECFLGKVNYVDYDGAYIDVQNVLNFITYKRTTFVHEQELRAVIWAPILQSPGDRSFIVGIDTDQLIQNVYVSPDSGPLLEDIVRQLVITYGLTASVRKSDVNALPNY